MQQKNRITWLYTLEFLEIFSQVYYDFMSISIPLLREFQKYVERHYTVAYSDKKNVKLNLNIQKACEPFLIKNKFFKEKGEYLLVRAELYSLTSSSKLKCIYLAHHRNEYKKMLSNKQCRPLYFLHDLPEKNIPISEEKKVTNQLNQLFSSISTPSFFKSKTFITWMRKEVKKLLVTIRKVHALFDKYSISKTLYGSTINRHGALITTFAQSRRIETINFQHGIFGEMGHLPINADRNLVWGKSHQEYLITYGAPLDKMTIVPPYFPKSTISTNEGELTSNHPKLLQDYVSLKNNVPSFPINILVALQPLSDTFNKKMLQHIEASANKFSGKLYIHYKLHPDQNSEYYKNLIRSPHSKLYIHGIVPLQELIVKADLIITHSSAVAYEALLYRKPVSFYSKPIDIYYLQGIPLFIRNSSEIYQLFLKIVTDPTCLSKLSSQISLKDDHKFFKSENYDIGQYLNKRS